MAALVRACEGAPDAARVVRRPVFLLRPLSLDKNGGSLYLAAYRTGRVTAVVGGGLHPAVLQRSSGLAETYGSTTPT